MSNRFAALAFGLFFMAICPVFADTAAPQPVEATTTEHTGFAPGGTIRLNHASGNLSVEGWDQPQVEVTIVRSMGYDSESGPKATRQLDSVKVVIERRSATELAISTTRSRIHNRFTHAVGIGRDPVVEYRIRVPRNSHLVIDHADGYVSISGVTGDIEANDRRGDIVLMVPDLKAYSIDAQTKLGVVTSDVGGTRHSKKLIGERFSHQEGAQSHKLLLRVGFGGITIKETPNEALAPAIAGN